MRQDNIELAKPPGNDRPGDMWMNSHDGEHTDQGKRVLTWTGHRRRWTLWFTTGVLLAAMLVFLVVPSEDLFKPGNLSSPHAQILIGAVSSDRCGACHTDDSLSPLAWFQRGSKGHAGIQQNDLCLDCHHRTMPQNLAYAAHNLPLSVRDQLSISIQQAALESGIHDQHSLYQYIPDAAVDQNNVACSSCHQEHHGADGDLLFMSNTQCQTCHSTRFGSFADSHPDWNEWPYGRGGEISFNHAMHQQKHFPGWKSGSEEFKCSVCHPGASVGSIDPADPQGEIVRVASYENSCKVCHDQAMNLQTRKGIDFVALPSLPDSVAAGLDQWPQGATGFTDGVIPPLTELLLRADPVIADLLRHIPAADLSQLPGQDNESAQRLSQLATEFRRLMHEFATIGHTAVQKRLSGLGISPGSFSPVLRSLPPQLIESANEKWFRDTPSNNSSSGAPPSGISKRSRLVITDEDDLLDGSLLDGDAGADGLLDGDLLGGDLLDQPLAVPTQGTVEAPAMIVPSKLVNDGGWYRDDVQLAVRYRGSGHSDPVLVGMIETFSQLRDGDPLKRRFFSDPSVVACISCHASAASVPSVWRAKQQIGQRSEFTKFSHRPHLNVSALGSCVHCHKISGHTAAVKSTAVEPATDFQPLGRQSCAVCHTAKASGESCTTCHRYHIGGYF